MRQDNLCGLSFWHPKWIQKFANSKAFMLVYGLLGTIQAMSYMYFIVTLTTLEKRFKIPSQTTGIILSGNEISQILLSLILSYAGGQRNRPRWIAWGIVFCGISCFILAVPHFIYGPGDEILQFTEEYLSHNKNVTLVNATSKIFSSGKIELCLSETPEEECAELLTILPLILIFLSQFVLGIGNTLYYSLGQTYLDDNTKMTNTPMMLAYAMSLRMLGPIGGFFLGYASLNMFIDPTKTPLIDKKDPRWLGAWWFGWTILGSSMLLFSGLIGMFPKILPKPVNKSLHSELPRALRDYKAYEEGSLKLNHEYHSSLTLDKAVVVSTEFPRLKDFPKALMRLLKNKLLMFNIIAAIFYILGAGGYMTFLTKYIEVQFHKTAQNATILVGPVTILGMVAGFLLSGFVISKKKPSPNAVLLWNIFIGASFLTGQILYMFIYCGDTGTLIKGGTLNLLSTCNSNCSCDKISYSPICHESTDKIFFSPCHAGCQTWDPKQKIYSNCSCLNDHLTKLTTDIPTFTTNSMKVSKPILTKRELTSLINGTPPTEMTFDETSTFPIPLEQDKTNSLNEPFNWNFNLVPGACVKGCTFAFYCFTALSVFINWLGSSGRIGNLLVNYRAVEVQDKSFAQGLTLMLISLFALIPGPIIYGRLIDSTCLDWTETCGERGHCQLYDQKRFRLYINCAAFGLTFIGVFFDILVWYYGRGLDLYGDLKQKHLKQKQMKNRTISPLLPKKT